MTRQDFLNKFALEADKNASLAIPGFEPEEIAAFASIAQERLILNKYNSRNPLTFEGFEQTEKRTADLGELVTNTLLTPLTYNAALNVTNGVFVQLPNDYPTDVFWLPVYEEVTINKKCNKKNIKLPVKEVTHVELNKLTVDPFNKPSTKNDNGVFRLRYSDYQHELVTDGTFSVLTYQLRYIKKPQEIDLVNNLSNQVSELSDLIHGELLEKTIEIILDSIGENQLAQIKKQTILNE